MEENTGKEKRNFWNFIDNFKGDKVIWMIVLLLILISLITIFASASGLAKGDTSRLDIFFSQFKLACAGLAIIILCYNIPSIGFIRFFSQTGFAISLALLVCLIAGFGTININGAERALEIFGMQVYIFEVIKVAMVMYLAWAIDSYKKDSFRLPKAIKVLSPRLGFVDTPLAKRMNIEHLVYGSDHVSGDSYRRNAEKGDFRGRCRCRLPDRDMYGPVFRVRRSHVLKDRHRHKQAYPPQGICCHRK